MLKHLIAISTLVVVASAACFDSGDKEIGGLCYKFVAQKLSYNDAVSWCHYQNPMTPSFLAYVPNQFSSNVIASYARSAFSQTDGSFWIGLSRSKNYNPWTWDTGYAAHFTNFNSDQLTQNYAAESVVNTKWNTFAADQKMNFVCSYDPNAPPTFGPPTTSAPSTTTVSTTTTKPVPTTTVTLAPCSSPFRGKIALAFEMTTKPQTQQIMHFIRTYLYNSTNYKFGDEGITQAINVPYPDSGIYENYIMLYSDARSADILDFNIGQLYSEVGPNTNPSMARAYEYILEERNPGTNQTNVLITVGIDSLDVDDGSASYYLQHLQVKYGFRSIAVSIGPNWSSIQHLAESPDWYFKATDDNGQWVADQISRIICNL